MVPGVGLEPTCPLGQPVLSGPRLPVAPPGHARHGTAVGLAHPPAPAKCACPLRSVVQAPLLGSAREDGARRPSSLIISFRGVLKLVDDLP